MCDRNEIEDEKHILLACPKYEMLRSNWLESMNLDKDNLQN